MALAIGGCTVEELKSRMSAREAEAWKYFLRINGPVGSERLDWNFALLRKIIADVNTSAEERSPAEDFLLKLESGGKKEENALVNNCLRLVGF
ncbi:hypothetical protein FACS18942_04990 [Planctomycetales bacterium]|nr:hypothetical protein FACS18942_04990 [Planctomycetales bacterium]GHT37048.1 hypothetical protein FACS189427_09540 [Planctomycetales bacterium]